MTVVEWHADLESTQDEAHRRAERGAPAGTVIAARAQRRGRGTRSRPWASPLGGLWMSVIARPQTADRLERLSVRAGVAIAAGLERVAGLRAGTIMLKWPNDLVLGDRKLGGILCEARWQGERPAWVVVGVGVNVRNSLPEELGDTAARLADWAPDVPAVDALAPPVADAVMEAVEARGLLTPAELIALERRDWLAGRLLVRPPGARVVGVAPDGRLEIRNAAGQTVTLLEPLSWADLAHPPASR